MKHINAQDDEATDDQTTTPYDELSFLIEAAQSKDEEPSIFITSVSKLQKCAEKIRATARRLAARKTAWTR